jgi:hypothetical protein
MFSLPGESNLQPLRSDLPAEDNSSRVSRIKKGNTGNLRNLNEAPDRKES